MLANIPPAGRDSIDAQAEMFRLIKVECGMTLDMIAKRSPLKLGTLKDWAKGAAVMPVWALGQLGVAGVPDHLLSLLLEPFSRHVGTDESGEGDLDTAGLDAGEVQQAIQRARHPNSPGGVAIVPQERVMILPLVRKNAASSRRAVA